MPLADFIAFPWAEPEILLDPWLHAGSISMLYGMRGAGKTNVSLAIALAVSSGEEMFTHMRASCPRRVLYVDGEMQPAQVKKRLLKFLKGRKVPDTFTYLTHASYEDGLPTLHEPESGGRALIEEAAIEAQAELIILDNISALVRGGIENDNDAWIPINAWLLSLRRQNYATLLIHHSGKRQLDGTLRQRGNSKKEDPMDTVIQIDETAKPRDGRVPLRWTYEKCRDFTPEMHTFDFSVCFDDIAGRAWLENGNYQSVANAPPPPWLNHAQELIGQGTSIKATARAIGQPYTTVHRWLTGRAFTIGDLGKA